MQKEDFAQAETWYQKAIAIDPNKETAYRYSATPLMKQGKTVEARDRYIEAFITEPYNKFARAGFVQWGQATHTNLAHPKIDIPTDVTFDEKGDAKINLDASVLLGGKDDGSFAWIAYGATRSTWHKEKFAKDVSRRENLSPQFGGGSGCLAQCYHARHCRQENDESESFPGNVEEAERRRLARSIHFAWPR